MAVEEFFLDRWVKQLGVRPSQTLLTYYSNVGVAEGSYTYAEFDGRTALLAATLRGKWSVATQGALGPRRRVVLRRQRCCMVEFSCLGTAFGYMCKQLVADRLQKESTLPQERALLVFPPGTDFYLSLVGVLQGRRHCGACAPSRPLPHRQTLAAVRHTRDGLRRQGSADEHTVPHRVPRSQQFWVGSFRTRGRLCSGTAWIRCLAPGTSNRSRVARTTFFGYSTPADLLATRRVSRFTMVL